MEGGAEALWARVVVEPRAKAEAARVTAREAMGTGTGTLTAFAARATRGGLAAVATVRETQAKARGAAAAAGGAREAAAEVGRAREAAAAAGGAREVAAEAGGARAKTEAAQAATAAALHNRATQDRRAKPTPWHCCTALESARSRTAGCLLRQNRDRRALHTRIARQFHAPSARRH